MAKNGRILVADDDAGLQWSVRQVAALHGYEVVSTEVGLEVVATAAQLQPELIVLDIRVPDADGRELLQQLKQNPNTAGSAPRGIASGPLAMLMPRNGEPAPRLTRKR